MGFPSHDLKGFVPSFGICGEKTDSLLEGLILSNDGELWVLVKNGTE